MSKLANNKVTLKILMLGESLSRQGGIVSVEKLILQEALPNIHYQHIATLVDGSITEKILAFLRALVELTRRILQNEVDLLHVHMSERGSTFRQAIVTLIAVTFRKPVLMHTHGSQFHLFYSKLPKWIKYILSLIFQQCLYFIVLSESWKTFYMNHFRIQEKRIIVLPNAVRIPLQVPDRTNSSDVTFLFLGRIGQRKGAFDLIQAFANINPERKARANLLLAGDGEIEELRHLVESLHIVEFITVIDWVDSQKRDELLANADVFILPSYNEGLPMAVLEAMSWGLPVITTPVGGIPEVVSANQNGLLVPPGNILQITASMEMLIEDENLRLHLGNNAKRTMATFDVRNYFDSLVEIYYSVLV
ncbi:glycosyl transferase family 1 [cyanobacterium TDX16]|nr:glycosyl transferase family 1 [cyanobacterium TDX16]